MLLLLKVNWKEEMAEMDKKTYLQWVVKNIGYIEYIESQYTEIQRLRWQKNKTKQTESLQFGLNMTLECCATFLSIAAGLTKHNSLSIP